jgi:hypothetical protein
VVAYALGELPLSAQLCFEERMAADHQLREEFLASLKLIIALSPLESNNPTPLADSLQHQPKPSTKRCQTTKFAPALTALVAAAVVAFSLYSPETRNADSLRDAVALSSILLHSVAATDPPHEINADSDSPIPHPAEQLETPGWLLTAVDLDEHHSTSENPVSEDEEAIF